MRMVSKKGSYEEFQKMRQWVLDNCPYALLNDVYDAKNNMIYLYFWDSDYIPEKWDSYVVRPTALIIKSEEDLQELTAEVIADLKKEGLWKPVGTSETYISVKKPISSNDEEY